MPSGATKERSNKKQKADLEKLLEAFKAFHADKLDAIKAIAEDLEDGAILNALDNFSELQSDLQDMADHLDNVLSGIVPG